MRFASSRRGLEVCGRCISRAHCPDNRMSMASDKQQKPLPCERL